MSGKSRSLLVLTLAAAVLAPGCRSSSSREAAGALIGALLGSVISASLDECDDEPSGRGRAGWDLDTPGATWHSDPIDPPCAGWADPPPPPGGW